MLIIFVAPIPVMIGIFLSIPVVIIIGIIGFAALILPPFTKSIRNRLHPFRRKGARPAAWHQWR